MTDGPFVEGKEASRRLHDHQGARPRRRARVGTPLRPRGSGAPDRGASLPGRGGRLSDDATPRRSRRRRSSASSARSTDARSPCSCACAATSTRGGGGAGRVRRSARAMAGDGRAAESGGMDHHHGAQPRGRSLSPRVVARRAARRSGAAARARRAGETGGGPVRDDQLRLIFTCCHPALAPERAGRAHAAPARRPDDGGDRARLPRPRGDDGAAARPREGKDPRRAHPVPRARAARAAARDSARCWRSSTSSSTRATPRARGDRLTRDDLCREAIRLGRLLRELMPSSPEAIGLLALMLLIESRRDARTTPMARSCCSRIRIARSGIARSSTKARRSCGAVSRSTARPVSDPGRDQRGAQRDAARAEDTDWRQIVALYDQHLAIAPSPIVRAPSRRRGGRGRRARGGARARRCARSRERITCIHAIRADLLRRLGRDAEAAAAYDAAIVLSENVVERAFLQEMRASLGDV